MTIQDSLPYFYFYVLPGLIVLTTIWLCYKFKSIAKVYEVEFLYEIQIVTLLAFIPLINVLISILIVCFGLAYLIQNVWIKRFNGRIHDD